MFRLAKLIILIINTSVMIANNPQIEKTSMPTKEIMSNTTSFIIEKDTKGIDDKMIISDIPDIDKNFTIQIDENLKDIIKFKFKKGCGTSNFEENLKNKTL